MTSCENKEYVCVRPFSPIFLPIPTPLLRKALYTQVMFKLILHAKAKALVFADRFWSHFNARSFANRSKSCRV